jgi:hypothetical protein
MMFETYPNAFRVLFPQGEQGQIEINSNDDFALLNLVMRRGRVLDSSKMEFFEPDSRDIQEIRFVDDDLPRFINQKNPLIAYLKDRNDLFHGDSFGVIQYNSGICNQCIIQPERPVSGKDLPLDIEIAKSAPIFVNYLRNTPPEKIDSLCNGNDGYLDMIIYDHYHNDKKHPLVIEAKEIAREMVESFVKINRPTDVTEEECKELLENIGWNLFLAADFLETANKRGIESLNDYFGRKRTDRIEEQPAGYLLGMQDGLRRAIWIGIMQLQEDNVLSRRLILTKFDQTGYHWVDQEYDSDMDKSFKDMLKARGEGRYGERLDILYHQYGIQREGDRISINCSSAGRGKLALEFPLSIPQSEIFDIYKDPNQDFRLVRELLGIKFQRS